MVYIILCMIVKNESRILERCIQSASSIIDAISICDTGSTDNTVEVINKYVEKIGGMLHQHEWKNFGHNRSLSFTACVETAKKLGYPLDQTFALLLDADMCLQVKPSFDKKKLATSDVDGYLFAQIAGSLFYYNTRMVRLSKPWKCVSVTHEYWACDEGKTGVKFDDLVIDDRNDGGCKSDKYERDIRLLTKGLEDEPDNIRYMYYLGQSYKDSGNPQEAIKWFTKRMDAGAWPEEAWYACLQIARCYMNMKEEEKGVYWYLKAYEMRPTRSESLYELSHHFRNNSKNNLAFMFGRHGSEIPFPDDLLFVNQNCHKFECDVEMSIAAYYTPFYRSQGLKAANKLILGKEVPQYAKNMALSNILHYLPKVTDSSSTITINAPTKYTPCNPCLVTRNKKTYGCVRTVNYFQNKGTYISRDADKKIRTRNFMCEFNPLFQATSQIEIVDNFARQKWEPHVLGLEDMRTFWFKGDWWFTCTSLMETAEGRPCQCLGKLTMNTATNTFDVSHFVRLTGSFTAQIEKNWLPFVHEGELHIIYSSQPFTILKVDHNTGACTIVKKTEFPGLDLSNFRGSSPPIRHNDKYLFVIHEVAFVNWRTYFHRVVEFNDNFEITRISSPFVFDHTGVEFCLSLINKDGNFHFGVGIEDASARVFTIPENKLGDLFA